MTETERKTPREVVAEAVDSIHLSNWDEAQALCVKNVTDAVMGALAAAAGLLVGEPSEEQRKQVARTHASYINPAMPSMIRGLYRADLREKSIQNMLDLAADLVQELIDIRAAGVTPPVTESHLPSVSVTHPHSSSVSTSEGVTPPAPSEAKAIHEPDEGRVYCVRCGGNWPCQPAPSPERTELIAEAREHQCDCGGSDCDADLIRRLADALASPVEAGEAKGIPFRFTDDEWRAYQAIPDQGYSHRHYIEQIVNNRLRGDRSE